MNRTEQLQYAANIARNPAAFHSHPELADALERMANVETLTETPVMIPLAPTGAIVDLASCYILRLDTRHFSFEAHGSTEEQAIEALGQCLTKHGEQTGLAPDWWEEFAGDFQTTPFQPGAAWRDDHRMI